MSAYMTLRAFSWQICLSPVFFEELCAALNSGQPTPLADEIFVSVLRGLAYDENREARARRTLELSSLDHVTWPEYVWEWLRLSNNPLSKLRSLEARQSAAQVSYYIPCIQSLLASALLPCGGMHSENNAELLKAHRKAYRFFLCQKACLSCHQSLFPHDQITGRIQDILTASHLGCRLVRLPVKRLLKQAQA